MSDSAVGRYWCYECHRVVTGVEESEPKCPSCDSGFVEEIWSRGASGSGSNSALAPSDGSRTSRPFWDPVLFGMLADSSRRAREQREEEEEDDDEEEDNELDREFEELLSRRRHSSAVIRVLHSLYFVDGVEFDEFDVQTEGEGERGNDDGASLVLINSSNQAFFVQGSLNSDRNQGGGDSNGGNLGISFGDYFLGPDLDSLMQLFVENDPNMYGTPPAKQEAVDALPTVNVSETLSCSVCLEDFEIGTEAKEMPCKHKFHPQCLFPWLELHCSCPLCRFQLPSDESKISNRSSNRNRAEDANRLNARNGTGNGANSGDDDESWITWVDDESWLPVPSPSNLVPLSEDEDRGGSSSNQNSSASSSRDYSGGGDC